MLTHWTSDRLFTRSHYRYESKRGLGVLPLGRGRGNGLPRATPGALRWLARWPLRGAAVRERTQHQRSLSLPLRLPEP